MKDRINKILEHYSLSSAQFAESIGVQRSSISHIISGRNKPSYDFIVKIIEHFNDLNPEWLLTGKGNMLKSLLNSPPYEKKADLFNQPNKEPVKQAEIQGISDTVFNTNSLKEHQSIDSITNEISIGNKQITNVNNVKFVVFVYEDNSFEILNKR